MEEEYAAMIKDAERYRWLRANGGRSWTVLETQQPATCDFYDAAVDEAMKTIATQTPSPCPPTKLSSPAYC